MNFKQLGMSLAACAAVVLAGCGGSGHHDGEVSCETETRADTYVAGLEKTGSAGYRVVLVQSTPGPPAKGDSTWHLRVVNAEGEPASDVVVEVTPFMPDHAHGTPINTVVTPLEEPAEFEAAPVNLWMPGYWDVTVDLSSAAGAPLDSVTFGFCIDG